MSDYEICSLWVNGAMAVATFLAVLVALFGERLRQSWTRPKLKLELIESAFTKNNLARAGWYYLLNASNERLESPASNVRVILTRVLRKSPDGLWQEQRFSGPIQVTWRWPDQMPQFATVGQPATATFGFLREGEDAFELSMVFYPNNLDPAIAANTPTRLVFRAVSDTSESDELIVEVAWDGGWAEERSDMDDHLKVTSVR